MTGNIAFDSASGCLSVVGEFTVYQAMQSHTQILAALESGKLRSVDMSGVTDFDTAGLQILLSLLRDARFSGRQIKVSQRISEVFDLVRLDRKSLQPSGELRR